MEINKNKDIKGLIRNISVKTPGLRKKVTIDEEKNDKTGLKKNESLVSIANGAAENGYGE